MSTKNVEVEVSLFQFTRQEIEDYLDDIKTGADGDHSKYISADVDLDEWETDELAEEINLRRDTTHIHLEDGSALIDAYAAILAGNQDEAIHLFEKATSSDFRRNAEACMNMFKP